MSPPSEIIRQLLIDLNIESGEEWDIFCSFLPEKPDRAICVYDTTGKLDGRLMGTGEQIEHPGIQIRIRSSDYEEGWVKANGLAETLDAEKDTIIEMESDSTYKLKNFSRTGGLHSLGMETVGSKRHYHFAINAILTLEVTDDEAPFVLAGWQPYWVKNN